LKLFGIQTPQDSGASANAAPSVAISTKTAASASTIQSILDAAATAKTAGSIGSTSGTKSTYADGAWDGFVQYGTQSPNSYEADTTQVAPGVTMTKGHNPPVQVRDPEYHNNYTLAQAEHNFYTANADYQSLHVSMTGKDIAAFDKAFQNRTLTFTSTSEIKDLQYSQTSFTDYDSSGIRIGGGGTASWSGGESLKANPNTLLTGNCGYKGGGETAGFVITW
jgi:hypothetical protein